MLKMKSWTVDEMMAEDPCYKREQIEEWYADNERMDILMIMLHPDVSDEDKAWICCRAHDYRAAWFDAVVARAVRTHALHCGVKCVEEWAARWLSGEDRTVEAAWAAVGEARAAAAAAWAAARAAWAAAEEAAAAWAAAEWAEEATEAAVGAMWATVGATWATVEEAEEARARAAWAAEVERKQQVQNMIDLLTDDQSK